MAHFGAFHLPPVRREGVTVPAFSFWWWYVRNLHRDLSVAMRCGHGERGWTMDKSHGAFDFSGFAVWRGLELPATFTSPTKARCLGPAARTLRRCGLNLMLEQQVQACGTRLSNTPPPPPRPYPLKPPTAGSGRVMRNSIGEGFSTRSST